jgi:hypothetical protein
VSHFLAPLLKRGGERCSLVNERTGSVVAGVLEVAIDSKTRRRGLLGRDALADDRALVLAPCNAVHTFFMRFPIDVAFVARDGRVVKTVESLRAWRVAAAVRAFATIEFRAGILRSRLVAGDRLVLRHGNSRGTANASGDSSGRG